MLTVIIAETLSTYTTCSFFLCNSILEKFYFLLLHVKNAIFIFLWIFKLLLLLVLLLLLLMLLLLLLLLLLLVLLLSKGACIVTRSLCCYISTNQQSRDRGASFKALFHFYSFSLYFSFLKLSTKTKISMITLAIVAQQCSFAHHHYRATSLWVATLPQREF
jgi:hypothetical protein